MKPTAWNHRSDVWDDEAGPRDRTRRRQEAAEEIAAQLRDAEEPLGPSPYDWESLQAEDDCS